MKREHAGRIMIASPLIANFHYRPEIDGLRAIAVLAVVFFHADMGVPGGFVGVDVFFVISGFLITSLILKDLETGTFTLVNFWERRARRILPAGVAMVMVVLVAGWFLLSPSDYAVLGKSAAWQAVFGANFHFWRTTNYFAGPAEEQPLLHTWSLAVEEQFYLFVPLILLLLFRLPVFRRRGPLLGLLGGGFLLSLLLSVVLLPRMPAATFYLLPTRAWELLCGSIIAILPAAAMPRWLRESLCGLALAAILIPCFLYSTETPFPGLAALPPCLGTGLFIWASGSISSAIDHSKFSIQHFLSVRLIVFIGLISYSLYLWHWPFFAFARYITLEPLSVPLRLAAVLTAFVFAYLSWKLVETPFRKRKLGATRGRMFIWAGSSSMASVSVAACLIALRGVPDRFGDRVVMAELAVSAAKETHGAFPETSLADARSHRFIRFGGNEGAQSPPALLVWGDSLAGCLAPGLEKLAEETSEVIALAFHPGTAPVANYPIHNNYSFGDRTPEYSRHILRYVREMSIPNVLLVDRWHGYCVEEGFLVAFRDTVAQLREMGCNVSLIKGIPSHTEPIPKLVFLSEAFGTDISPFVASATSFERQWDGMRDLEEELTLLSVNLIELDGVLMDSESGYARLVDSGGVYYHDHVHLSPYGARAVSGALALALRP